MDIYSQFLTQIIITDLIVTFVVNFQSRHLMSEITNKSVGRSGNRASKRKNSGSKSVKKSKRNSIQSAVPWGSSKQVDGGLDSIAEPENLSQQLNKTLPYNAHKDHKPEYQSICGFLDDYDNILGTRIKALQQKWSCMQILQESVHQEKGSLKIVNKGDHCEHLLEIQNNFYIQKITQLQKELKQKERELKSTRRDLEHCQRAQKHSQLSEQNQQLQDENSLLTRQNQVLRGKLKEAGIL